MPAACSGRVREYASLDPSVHPAAGTRRVTNAQAMRLMHALVRIQRGICIAGFLFHCNQTPS